MGCATAQWAPLRAVPVDQPPPLCSAPGLHCAVNPLFSLSQIPFQPSEIRISSVPTPKIMKLVSKFLLSQDLANGIGLVLFRVLLLSRLCLLVLVVSFPVLSSA